MDSTVQTFLLGAANTPIDYKEVTALNKFVTDMKFYGQWQYIDGFWPEFMTDSNLCKTNIVTNSAYTSSGTISHLQKRGTANTATSGNYINTGLNISTLTSYKQNNAVLMVHVRDNFKEGSVDVGAYDGTSSGSWLADDWTDGNDYYRCNTNSSGSWTNPDARGIYAVQRTTSGTESLWKDGIIKVTRSTTSTSVVNANLFLGSATSTGFIGTRRRSFSLIGAGAINIPLVTSLLSQLLINAGANIRTVHAFGDSITFGTAASPITNSFVNLLGSSKNIDIINYGVSGQTVSQGTDNPLSFSTIPVKNSTAGDYKIIFAYGVNDCWKTQNGNSPTTDLFKNWYTQAIYTALANGWSLSDILIIDGFYVDDNTNFTQATYYTYVQAIQDICNSLGIQYASIRDYMTVNGGTSLVSSTDHVHPTNTGHSIIYEGLKTYF